MWGNCWTYAVSRWLKEGWRKTYLIVRMTRVAWFPVPHVMFARSIEGVEVSEFKAAGRWVRMFRGPFGRLMFPLISIVFPGRIRHGIGEENSAERKAEEDRT